MEKEKDFKFFLLRTITTTTTTITPPHSPLGASSPFCFLLQWTLLHFLPLDYHCYSEE